MGKIDSRSLWLFGYKGNILQNKQMLIDSYFKYMQIKCLEMFEWKNLPKTIPQRELELILQICRFAIFTEVKGKLFVFYGGLAGMPNEYYQPTQAIVSNPYLRFSDVLKLDDYIKDDGNAVLGWNDGMHIGLFSLHSKYACLLAETDLTLKYQLVNLRFNNILTADDDPQKESIKKMYEEVSDGTGFGIIVTKKFMQESNVDKIELRSQSHQMQLKDTIETKQYLMGSWYNELGLNANYNMKREAINESEADMNEDTLLPLIDNMLKQRKLIAKSLNEKFSHLLDGEVDVEISSSWKKIQKEIQIREKEQIEQIKDDVSENDNDEVQNDNQ
ncbi:MAG: hypothetical protein J6T10_27210 [Methanobrevibacter sp.]|nr:hypothetical protein [Methanobrevibacter sp.]